MNKASDHGYFIPLTFDVRVRERLHAAGNITQPQVERYLSELPDLEAQAESLGIDQPALGGGGGSHAVAPSAPAATTTSDGSTQHNEAGPA
jgi:hypothetical protein